MKWELKHVTLTRGIMWALGVFPWTLPLLENRPSAQAEEGQRNRFPNRCHATATNGLALRHRVFNRCLRLPLVPVGNTNRYQRGCHVDARWQPLWYRLIFPTGTNDIFSFFPNPVLFVIFITVYSFIIAKRTQALQYSTFIGCSCSFSENIWN